MTVPTTSMPSDLTFGKVVGRFILAVADASDPDRLPDATPALGNITLTPVNPNLKANSPTPTTVVRAPVRCSVDNNGNLIDPQGSTGVWLSTGIYKVTYNLANATINSHNIEVLGSHDDAHPLDLTNALPAGIPLTPTQYEELSAQIAAASRGSQFRMSPNLSIPETGEATFIQPAFPFGEVVDGSAYVPDIVVPVGVGDWLNFGGGLDVYPSLPDGGGYGNRGYDLAVIVDDEVVWWLGAQSATPMDEQSSAFLLIDGNPRQITDASWIRNGLIRLRTYFYLSVDPSSVADGVYVGGQFWFTTHRGS